MDIWSWVYDMQEELEKKGHPLLANALFKLPSDTVEGNHQEIDLYIEQIVAEAKQSGFTWVELFLRHWYLQSKILHRGEPRDAIKEAVSLLDFAHTEENKDCPQSICVVQDLGSCYGQFDGPGYSDQRIAVAREGLEKINPDWPCYKCISAEYAEALRDAKRYDECIRFLEKTDNTFIEHGLAKDTSNLLIVKVYALMRQGKLKDARQQGKKLQSWGGGSNFEMDAITLRALIEAHDGEYQNALKLLPNIEKILKEDSSLLVDWAETMTLIIPHIKKEQTQTNIEQLLNVANIMHERGTYRQAFDTYARIIPLANIFPDAFQANDLFEIMTQIKQNFNQDFGASKTLKDLGELIEKKGYQAYQQ